MGCKTGLRVRRHDAHCIELVALVEGGESGRARATTWDFYFFFPETFASADALVDLRRDVRSRLRMALPDRDGAAECFVGHGENFTDRVDEDRLRRFVAVAAEKVRGRGRRLRDRARVALSVLCTEKDVEEAAALTELEQLSEFVRRVRADLTTAPAELAHIAAYGDEYLTHLYGRTLWQVHRTVGEARSYLGVLPWQELPKALARCAAEEGGYRAKRYPGPVAGDGEQHLLRLSQLKKFFQGAMYLDLQTRAAHKKLSEPIAVAGAAFGALAAFQAQAWHSGHGSEAGAMVLSASVAAYVLKDRLKDQSRRYLQKHASRWFPEVDEAVYVGERSLGRHQEWIETLDRDEVPEAIRSARRDASVTPLEERLPGDTVRLRLRQKFAPASEPWAVQTTVRWNIEGFLRHLDEPYKTVRLLKEDGAVSEERWHRVYPIYLVAQPSGAHSKPQVWRCVLDKRGLDRVERVDLEDTGNTPPTRSAPLYL